MEEKCYALVNEFENLLSKSQRDNYLPIIRNTFIPYILKKHKNIKDITKLFLNEITPDDIINAGIAYVDNTERVTGENAVNKFLSSVSEFYNRVIFVKYPTSLFVRFKDDFQQFRIEIIESSNKELKKSEAYEHLSKGDYDTLIEYLNNYEKSSYKELTNNVMYKLILLYGFKIGIITDLNKEDYSCDRNTLRIFTDMKEPILLELPYTLSKEITLIVDRSPCISEKLFLTEDGNLINSTYADDELKKIYIAMKKKLHTTKKFTTTSLSKYAVIEMFIKGINPYIIGQISGMKDVNLKYCQTIANGKLYENYNSNRYINSKMRAIATYDDFH